jgi:hypothetical protein
MLWPRTLDSRGLLLLLLGIWDSRHGRMRALRPGHRRLLVLRSRSTGLHIRLLLPWSLLIVRRPLRVKLRWELVRIHVSFILVGVQDHVEGEIHQGREREVI